MVTVLFADVVGSTALGERLDPERFREVMEAYFRAMRPEIEAEGGTVEKFIGDAVMAVFGVPVAHEDDAARALRAALRMRERQRELNTSLPASLGVTLGSRIGINTGEVVAVPDHRPEEGMVIGDTVNVAARLEQSAEPDQILVSRRTARAARGFRFRDRGSLMVKGKRQAVMALELEGEAPEAGGEELEAAVPLVGRDQEMAVLRSLFARISSEGRPHLATIYGEAGVGKSRLAAEFLAQVQEANPAAQVVRGRCLPYGEGVTYWPLAEILKSRAGVLDSDGPVEALKKVRDAAQATLLHSSPEDVPRVVAALAFTVGLDDPGSPFADMEPRQVRFETHEAWREYFVALAASGPTVAVIEDIHWADPSLLDLLDDLAARVRGPVLFLCPSRPDLSERRPAWGGGRRNFSSIELQPLPPADAARMVQLLVPGDDIGEPARRRILERAEGNPFFLEEIVRHLVDEGRIERSDGRARLVGTLDEVDIPDTVQAVLAARIDLLDPADRRALQGAAVVGRVFWAGPLRELVDVGDKGLDETMARLEERELIGARVRSTIGGEREFHFKHTLTRDVAYASLTRKEKARAHASVAAWIERTAGERRREFAELLAHHYDEALRADPSIEGSDHRELLRDRAFGYLLAASEEARRKLVLGPAEHLAERAVGLAVGNLERSRALEALGEACLLDYLGDRAWEHLRDAADAALAGAPEDGTRIARLCARALESPTRWGAMRAPPEAEEARRYLELGLSRVGAQESEELTRLLVVQSTWPLAYPGPGASEDDCEGARAAGERAAGMAERLGLPDLASAALDGVGTYYYGRGRYGRMDGVTKRRLDLVPRLTDPREIEDTFAMAAWSAFHTGHYQQAFDHADQGFTRTEPVAPAVALHCLEWRALARYRLGDWDGFLADIAVAEQVRAGRAEHPAGFISRPYTVGALILEIQGDPVGADRLLDRWAWHDDPEVIEVCAPWLALREARRGRFDRAREHLGVSGTPVPPENLGLALEARCDVVGEQGDWSEAERTVALARAHAADAGLVALPFHADRLEGRWALASGEMPRAVELLSSARDGFDRLAAAWEAAVTALDLARALGSTGRAEHARAEAGSVVGLFRDLRSARELSAAQALAAG